MSAINVAVLYKAMFDTLFIVFSGQTSPSGVAVSEE
jgi:hypothetical protein